MDVISEETTRENPTDRFPLLMEQAQSHGGNEYAINIEQREGSADNHSPRNLETPNSEDRPSDHSSSNFRSPSVTRRSEGSGRRWSPVNTLLWISIELVFTLGQIVAAVVVLYLSTHEKPRTPLFAWVVGYTAGCTASLPLLYWRYIHRYRAPEQRSAQLRQGSPRINSTGESNSYITISLTHPSDEDAGRNRSTDAWTRQSNPRIASLLDYFKMALDCFFAVWFVVGNIWIFGGHSSVSSAPNLYRLCIVFLVFSCIGYAMPFILCAMICCCLPCIISVLGVREDMYGMRGASEESINALPTHMFKINKSGNDDAGDGNSEEGQGGCIAAGTEKERSISGEDAICCICLAKYEDNEELRELPCSHFFHTECVDKWLKINASCPLCKFELCAENENSASE